LRRRRRKCRYENAKSVIEELRERERERERERRRTREMEEGRRKKEEEKGSTVVMLGLMDARVFSTFASAGYFGETKLLPSLHQNLFFILFSFSHLF